jgi:fatty acid desaturase
MNLIIDLLIEGIILFIFFFLFGMFCVFLNHLSNVKIKGKRRREEQRDFNLKPLFFMLVLIICLMLLYRGTDGTKDEFVDTWTSLVIVARIILLYIIFVSPAFRITEWLGDHKIPSGSEY